MFESTFESRLRDAIAYNPDTGVFTWKIDRAKGKIKAGSEAGSFFRNGYKRICFENKQMLGHRVAWLLHYGHWPTQVIDHIDGNPANNCMANLRDVSLGTNQRNRISAAKHNNLGVLGVVKRGNVYSAHTHKNKKQIYIGTFESAEAAHRAYLDTVLRLEQQ